MCLKIASPPRRRGPIRRPFEFMGPRLRGDDEREVALLVTLAAALLAATPLTLDAQLAAAKSGDTVKLSAEAYPAVRIAGRKWATPVTLDARGATLATLTIADVTGLRVVGAKLTGTVAEPFWIRLVDIRGSSDLAFDGLDLTGKERAGFGLYATLTRNLTIENSTFKRLHTGIQFDEIDGGRIAASDFRDLRSDGVDLAASRKIVVDNIECSGTEPKLEPPADHPDCVQMWSKKGVTPLADITIRNSRAFGKTQGFSGFDHGEGGFDRITITGNTVRVTYPDGISLHGARDSTIAGNRVETLPGAPWQAKITVIDSERVTQRRTVVVTPPASYLQPPR